MCLIATQCMGLGLAINWTQWPITYARSSQISMTKCISLPTMIAYGTSCISSCLAM